MFRRVDKLSTFVALLTVGVALSAREGLKPLTQEHLNQLKIHQYKREQAITRSLDADRYTLGLGMFDGLKSSNCVTDQFGKTHVRYRQTYRGVEVYGGVLLAHMDASGSMEPIHAALQRDIGLEPRALLDEPLLRKKILCDLPEGSAVRHLHIKPIVFPTRYQDGIKFMRIGRGNYGIDPTYSVVTPQKAEPYRWAFQASVLHAQGRGLRATEYILDGQTGEFLRKWDACNYVDTPSVGTGKGQYNGTVSLNTLQLTDSTGEYTLVDTTRGTKPTPLTEILPQLSTLGNQTVASDFFMWEQRGFVPYLHSANEWGNGEALVWDDGDPSNRWGVEGHTAAADAHYGVQCTWDYLRDVLGRDGVDGQGTAVIAAVHCEDLRTGEFTDKAGNWSGWLGELLGMTALFSDGAPTGGRVSLDVVAHELCHGVNQYTANLRGRGFGPYATTFDGEPGGLNEANSDIHATMVKYYVWGADGHGSAVPDETTKAPDGRNSTECLWSMGAQLSQDGVTPYRYLYKPSLDGESPDAWFSGIGLYDWHNSCGPANRAFYFLCRGASGTQGAPTYSQYLPSGMTGIGNDKAIHIWYHAMSTKIADSGCGYEALREAMIEAAKDLFPGSAGADSSEIAAVKNAFAAINLGAAAGGSEPIRVAFPYIGNSVSIANSTMIFLPAQISLKLVPPEVSHASDSSVVWSWNDNVFDEWGYNSGRIDKDGTFMGPSSVYGAVSYLKAASCQDPMRFAIRTIYSFRLDCDADTVTDACDLGALALTYNDIRDIYETAFFCDVNTKSKIFNSNLRNQVFLEAFHNAFSF